MPSTESDSPLLQRYLQALASASKARDMERALAIGEEATQRGIEHPNLLGLAAQKYMRAGNVEAAYPLLGRARELSPGNADVLNDLGLCLVRLGRAREALHVLDDALRSRPDSAQVHFSRALAHEQLGQLDDERRELERVIATEPRHYPALSLLAMLAVDRNDVAAVRDYAGRALALSPGGIPAQVALATADVATKDYVAARNRLRSLLADPSLDPDSRAQAQTLMGDVLDGEKRYDEAFRCYAASAETQRRHYAGQFGATTSESYRARNKRLREYFQASQVGPWRRREAEADTQEHVFLLGFVRSGTTVLGQILAGHPDVEVMHERDCVEEAVREFAGSAEGLDRFAGYSDSALEPCRRAYWNRAREWGYSTQRGVFIDKSPLATSLLPLIVRLFPRARILFAHRDPRDVVFSCFRRRFAMSQLKFEMLTLEDIATSYASTMDLADLYRQRLEISYYGARHESLLSDLDAETKRICEHLGIAFDAKMLDFSSRARTVNIDIPNSAGLARGLSRENEGHWRHYERELAPIMPMLAPIRARLGYPET